MNTADLTLRNEEKVIFSLRNLYRSYGYRPFRMSKFEEYDLYVRNKSFLVSDNIITFTDTDGRLLALKPDVTLSIVKNARDGAGLRKVYYNENVYRPSGDSRNFREIMQAGLECIGNVDDYCVSEVLRLAQGSLEVISDDYALDVSDLGMLSRAIDELALSDDNRAEIVRFIGSKNLHDLTAACAALGIAQEKTAAVRALLSCPADPAGAIEALLPVFDDDAWRADVRRFAAILAPLPQGKVRVDFSVINDFSYYNGIVFQGFVRGVPEALLSGGQYDNLMRKMNRTSGAVGFAVYLDRLEYLPSPAEEYDADTLLLYSADDDPAAVARKAALLAEECGVFAAREIPEKFKCRRIVRFNGKDGE